MKLPASSLLILTVALAVFPLFQGKFYATGDTRDIFIPLETFFHNEMLAGRLPAWNSDVSWGFPVIASAQIGFFYPPLLLTRWLPIWLYLPLNLAGHLIATAIGMYLFLRKLGRSNSASYLGAISFTLGAFIFQHLTHLNIIFAIAWFPYQLIFAKKPSLKLAFFLGLPFLVGQIQIPFLMAAVTCIYAIKAWKKLLWVGVLAFGIAAAQLFPTAELAWHSTRGQNNDFNLERANQYSWPLYHLPTLLFPRFFGNDDTYWGKKLQLEQGFFIGTIPLLLALSSLGFRHSICWFFKWLTIISFLLALGSLSPFRITGLEPSLWLFSAPARWLLFTTFGLSVLAAFGWDNIFSPSEVVAPRLPRRWLLVALFLTTFILLFNLALFKIPDSLFQNPKIHSLVSSARLSSVSLLSPYTALPIVLLVVTPLVLKRRFGKQVLLAVATLELVIIAAFTNPVISWRNILAIPDTVAQLPESVRARQARLHTVHSFENTGAYFTNPESLENAARRQLIPRLLPPLVHAQFNLLGVAWPASLDLANEARVLSELNQQLQHGKTELAEELNIASLLHLQGVVGTDSLEVGIKVLKSKPRAEVSGDPAEYREITPSRIQIRTNSSEPGKLIIRDTFYPGWTATLDSTRRVEIRSAGPTNIFRAVQVPAGEHIIDIRYQPQMLYTGIIISVLSLALGSLSANVNSRT